MTAEEFLEELARTPRDWRLMGGKIRRGSMDNPDCPITAVACKLALLSAEGLSLDGETTARIVAATDNLVDADPYMRMSLLEACGILNGGELGLAKPEGQGD
jgi:hypothetical protein